MRRPSKTRSASGQRVRTEVTYWVLISVTEMLSAESRLLLSGEWKMRVGGRPFSLHAFFPSDWTG